MSMSVNSRRPNVHKGYWWHFSCLFVDRKNKRESYFYASFQNCDVLRTPQAPGDATVLKRFSTITSFFSPQVEKNSILESVNFYTCVYMHIFNLHDGHVTTFRHPSGPISAKCMVTYSPDQQKAHLQSLGFPSVLLVWGKSVSRIGCAWDRTVEVYRKKREKCCFSVWLQPTNMRENCQIQD